MQNYFGTTCEENYITDTTKCHFWVYDQKKFPKITPVSPQIKLHYRCNKIPFGAYVQKLYKSCATLHENYTTVETKCYFREYVQKICKKYSHTTLNNNYNMDVKKIILGIFQKCCKKHLGITSQENCNTYVTK